MNGFQFSSEYDQDTYKTLNSLVKYNDGLFKSAKQAAFLIKQYKRSYDVSTTENLTKSLYGFDMQEGQIRVSVDAYIRWTDYGSDSYRPVSWQFILDECGVVAVYKLAYRGSMRQGTSPDPSKTKCIFTRTVEAKPFVQEEKPVVESTSKPIGRRGDRIEIHGVITFVKEFSRAKMHYYDSGIGHVTNILDNGNEIVYFGHLGDKGDTVSVKATVKEHREYNGRVQTVVSRPRSLA